MSLAKPWMDLLAARGYRPLLQSADEYPEIAFQAEDRLYRLFMDESDPAFFGMVLACDVPDELRGPARLLDAANRMNDAWKVAKTIIDPERFTVVRFHFEALVDRGGPSAELLGRALSSLHMMAGRFFEEVAAGSAPVMRC